MIIETKGRYDMTNCTTTDAAGPINFDKECKARPLITEKEGRQIRSQASNWMLGDDDFLKMINGEIKP